MRLSKRYCCQSCGWCLLRGRRIGPLPPSAAAPSPARRHGLRWGRRATERPGWRRTFGHGVNRGWNARNLSPSRASTGETRCIDSGLGSRGIGGRGNRGAGGWAIVRRADAPRPPAAQPSVGRQRRPGSGAGPGKYGRDHERVQGGPKRGHAAAQPRPCPRGSRATDARGSASLCSSVNSQRRGRKSRFPAQPPGKQFLVHRRCRQQCCRRVWISRRNVAFGQPDIACAACMTPFHCR